MNVPGWTGIITLLGLGSAACAPKMANEPTEAPAEPGPQTEAAPAPSPEELAQIAEDAWVWGYPLVLMQTTMKQATSVSEPGDYNAPLGQFARAETLADPSMRLVVRPNVDTLYASAWLDLRGEPTILHVPDTGGRYHVIPVLDAWTNAVTSIGSRTTGNTAADYALVGPGWTGTLPEGVKEVRSPTNLVWIGARTAVAGPADLPSAREVQDGYTLTPLSTYMSAAEGTMPEAEPGEATGITPPAVIDSRPPATIVATMDGATFYAALAEALVANPPDPADPDTTSRFATIGLVPGQPLDRNALPTGALEAMNAAPERAMARIEAHAAEMGAAVAGWNQSPKDTADFGTRYDDRAAVALRGFLANLPADATYYITAVDTNGAALTGANGYRLRFGPGEEPPNQGFWSVTVYDQDGFLVNNSLDRYALGSTSSLVRGKDGSATIYVQHDAPEKKMRPNWIPAPEGPFTLTMRVYWPGEAVLDGTWSPPAVEPVTPTPGTR